MNRARNNNTMGGMNNGRNLNGSTTNNGGTTYGLNPNGGRLNGTLAEQIRALCFVKVELELYLDTHPDCKVALDYYHKTIDALAALMEQYHASGGNPLVAAGSVDSEKWNWNVSSSFQNGKGFLASFPPNSPSPHPIPCFHFLIL